MTHDQAVQSALLAGTRAGGRLFPRHVGLFWDMRGKKHRIGVVGEADLQGILSPGGWAFAVEVKTGKATRTDEQEAWAQMWVQMRGLYVLARYSATHDGDAVILEAVARFRAART
jgi:hypothetical protein